MLQDRARGGPKEEGTGARTRPPREVGGDQGAVDQNDAIKKEGSAVGRESQDGLTDIAAAAGKVKWSVIGRQRCHLAA